MAKVAEFCVAARDGNVAAVVSALEGQTRLDNVVILNRRFCLPDATTQPGTRLVYVTPLSAAAQQGHAAVVRALLAHDTACLDLQERSGVDAICTGSFDSDRFGLTQLQLASKYGHPECVRELLRAGANVRAAKPGRTSLTALALTRALPAGANRTAVVVMLQAAGAPEDVEPLSEKEWQRINGVFVGHSWL